MFGRIENYLKKVVSPVSGFLSNICIGIIILVVLLVVTDVCLRRLFNAPITGTTELSQLAFSIIVFLPLAWCALIDAHIELNLLTNKLPKTTQQVIKVIITFATTIMVGLMSWQILVQGAKLQAASRETSLLGIPFYPFLYLAAFGSAMLTLAFFMRFLRSLNNVTRRSDESISS